MVYYIPQGVNCIMCAGGLVVQLYPSGGFKVIISSGLLYPSRGMLSCGYIILCIYGVILYRHYFTLRYNDGSLRHSAGIVVSDGQTKGTIVYRVNRLLIVVGWWSSGGE